jgi:hypothetical protein
MAVVQRRDPGIKNQAGCRIRQSEDMGNLVLCTGNPFDKMLKFKEYLLHQSLIISLSGRKLPQCGKRPHLYND